VHQNRIGFLFNIHTHLWCYKHITTPITHTSYVSLIFLKPKAVFYVLLLPVCQFSIQKSFGKCQPKHVILQKMSASLSEQSHNHYEHFAHIWHLQPCRTEWDDHSKRHCEANICPFVARKSAMAKSSSGSWASAADEKTFAAWRILRRIYPRDVLVLCAALTTTTAFNPLNLRNWRCIVKGHSGA
jgi:hypothetical protein